MRERRERESFAVIVPKFQRLKWRQDELQGLESKTMVCLNTALTGKNYCMHVTKIDTGNQRREQNKENGRKK